MLDPNIALKYSLRTIKIALWACTSLPSTSKQTSLKRGLFTRLPKSSHRVSGGESATYIGKMNMLGSANKKKGTIKESLYNIMYTVAATVPCHLLEVNTCHKRGTHTQIIPLANDAGSVKFSPRATGSTVQFNPHP